MLDVVDEVVLSCEVGSAKPDPDIYATALQRVGAVADDVLFIDDTPTNVAAAESLGMTGYVHISSIETIARIERFLRERT